MSVRRSHSVQRRTRSRARSSDNPGVIVAPVDKSLVIIIIFLVMFGIMAVFSAGAPEGLEFHSNAAYFAIKHTIFIAFGIIFLNFTVKLDYTRWKELAVPFSLITIALIAATYVPGLGRESYGASRWLVFLPIQPSELAKIAAIVLAASAISEAKSLFDEKIIKNFGLILIMVVLILHQPNLSIAMMITVTFGAMMLVGGVSFFLLMGMGMAAIPFVLHKISHTKYQSNRIVGWLNPWADPQGTGYNLIQSWYAISSGGIFGVGFGNSKQKLFWLPFRHTDFIFAVIAEELGLIGCVLLIGLFIAFIQRGFIISNRCSDMFGKLVAFGITFSIGMQALINIGVATGVLPVTGVTLPLISYGGSSIIVTMTMLGILLNISKKRIKRIQIHEAEYTA